MKPATDKKRWLRFGAGAACAMLVLGGQASIAYGEPAGAAGKGIAGGALLGAEVTVIGEAIGGVETPWLYWMGAAAGAAAGGVGGYYLEQHAPAELSFYSLLVGMALTIPTSLVYLNATLDTPDTETHSTDGGPNYDEEPEPLTRGTDIHPSFATSTGVLRSWPPSLIEVNSQSWRLSVPNLRVLPVFSPTEQVEFGLSNGHQWVFDLFASQF